MARPAAWLAVLLLLGGWFALGSTPAEDLIALGKRVEQRVVKLRGLEALKPVHWEVTNKEKIRAYLLKTLKEQYAPGEMEQEGCALKALGLIPRSMDFVSFVLALYEEQVGGYYDPKQDTFFLADWIAPALQETIISHELTHALQDQHFNIDRFTDRLRGNSDAMYARMALVEGEATLVMLADAMKTMGMELDLSLLNLDGALGQLMMTLSSSQFPKFSEAPRALREALLFPYVKGLNFVVEGRKPGGWKRIGEIYSDLPASTEQIIHPQKYFTERDPPAKVSLSFLTKLVPAEWEKIYEDVLGEFMTLELLESVDDEDEGKRAAAGWDGDQLWVYQRGSELAWVQVSVWDSEKDAVEFAGAFAKTVALRMPGAVLQPLTGEPRMVWSAGQDRVVLVAREGARILVVENLEPEVAERVRQAALVAP